MSIEVNHTETPAVRDSRDMFKDSIRLVEHLPKLSGHEKASLILMLDGKKQGMTETMRDPKDSEARVLHEVMRVLRSRGMYIDAVRRDHIDTETGLVDGEEVHIAAGASEEIHRQVQYVRNHLREAINDPRLTTMYGTLMGYPEAAVRYMRDSLKAGVVPVFSQNVAKLVESGKVDSIDIPFILFTPTPEGTREELQYIRMCRKSIEALSPSVAAQMVREYAP